MLYPESLIKRDFENKRKANKKRIEKSMREWKEYKLGDICNISSSKRIFAEEYVSSGIPFYRGKEIIEKHNKNTI